LVVDPDMIAREYGLSAIGAGRKAIEIIEEHLTASRSFSVETTLSGHSHVTTVTKERALGYRIELYYVGTGDVEINLERIRQRVAAGGHNVPEVDVRRRYERGLVNTPSINCLSDKKVNRRPATGEAPEVRRRRSARGRTQCHSCHVPARSHF
jgi:predicted ABC-type ATPase